MNNDRKYIWIVNGKELLLELETEAITLLFSVNKIMKVGIRVIGIKFSKIIQIFCMKEINKVIDKYSRVNSEDVEIGLMSIFWTQKVKLFYAALLANNSHWSGVM